MAGVAWNLEQEFRALGATVERYTFDDARAPPLAPALAEGSLRRAHPRRLAHGLVQHVGTMRARRFLASRPDAVSICHNNVLVGDVYVNHGLLLASMRARGRSTWRIFRNPVHVFIYLRDRVAVPRPQPTGRSCACPRRMPRTCVATYGPVRPRIVVIPNGVDLERFRPPTPDERRAARAELGLGNEERVAVFVGHEFSRKGLSFAIRGLQVAPSVLLLIIGGNDDIIARGERRGAGARRGRPGAVPRAARTA